MPFKSDKQREYFFAKLHSLPKGSPQYKKWKKVVDKFVAHSVDEEANLLTEKKGFISEDFKSQEQNYINQGNDPQIVKTYIERFRKIRDKNYKQLNDQIGGLENVRDRKNIDSYKTFKELETIVDYVGGQIDLAGTSLGKDIEIDAKPIYEDNIFEIYYADSPRACIKYKGNIPYGWCVSRSDSSNMYYTYRFKQNEPSFYFVKIKDRTKKELGFFNMVGNVFNGEFKDKYHFFVIQVIKGAKIGDTTTKQYIVTSAMNEVDKQMSWDEIVAIEPRIANLQEIFKSVELSPEDKEFYERFKNGTDDKTFCKLDYASKRRYLDVYIMPPEKLLTDTQFKCLPEDLMNLYVGFGVGLSEGQFELIKSNKNLLKRYQQITEKKVEIYLKNENSSIQFNYSELLILPENKRKELVINLNGEKIMEILQTSSGYIWNGSTSGFGIINNMLINIGGKDFIMNLDNYGIEILLNYSSEPDKIIDMLNKYGDNKGKKFIMNLDNYDIEILLKYSSEPDKIIDMLNKYGDNKGKKFIMNLEPDNFEYLSLIPEKIKQILQKYGKLPKELTETTTPLNEIFNSLTSLQEELNKQNKVNVKQKNLEKVKQFLLERQLLDEKDNRQFIVNKMGLSQKVADFAHEISDKYSIWIANTIKTLEKDGYIDMEYDNGIDLINNRNTFERIVAMFRDENKPPLNIKNLTWQEALDHVYWFNYIKDWRDNPNTPSVNLKNMSWDDAIGLSREWHESLGKGGKVSDILDEYDEIIHKFSNGFYWVLRKSNTCPKSAESMGHCATASEYDMYLFRLIKNDEEFITADYDSIGKFIIQLKGKANTKPKEKYYPYIMWLIADSGYINDLRTDEGYESETNFHLDDLNDEQLKYVISKNPSLFNLNLIMRSSNPEKIFILLYKQLGKKLFVKFRDTIFSNLIERAKNSDEFFDTLYNIGNKEFIEYLSWKNMYDFIKKSKNHDKILNILGDDKVKEFIMNASFNLVYDMYDSIKNYTKDLKKYKVMILDRIKNEYHPEDLKSTTPMNEIFKSLTSLQEELTEQRKLTIKESNLMKVQNFIKNRKNNQ